MLVEAIYSLSPPSAFGLPGDDYTVLLGGPGGMTQIVSPPIDSITGNIVGHGTLSSYRSPENFLNLSFNQKEMVLQIRDNFVTIRLYCDTADQALESSLEAVEGLCLWLSHHLSAVVTPKLVQLVDREKLERIPTPRIRNVLHARYFHIPTIEQGVREWELSPDDQNLQAALRYYRLGLFLQEHALESFADLEMQLLNEAIANYCKAVLVVLGDPSQDRDYQSRYKRFGMSYGFFITEVEWLRQDVRNQGGIAHPKTIKTDINTLIEWSNRGRRIAQEVIGKVKEHVNSVQQESDGQ